MQTTTQIWLDLVSEWIFTICGELVYSCIPSLIFPSVSHTTWKRPVTLNSVILNRWYLHQNLITVNVLWDFGASVCRLSFENLTENIIQARLNKSFRSYNAREINRKWYPISLTCFRMHSINHCRSPSIHCHRIYQCMPLACVLSLCVYMYWYQKQKDRVVSIPFKNLFRQQQVCIKSITSVLNKILFWCYQYFENIKSKVCGYDILND